MSEEVIKVAATAVASLVVGFVLFQLQRGGRRRRLRQEIREELELIELLDDGSAVRERIRAHVGELLEAYAPEHAEPATAQGVAIAFLACVITLVAAIVVRLLPDEVAPEWLSLTTLLAATAGAGAAAFMERKHAKALAALKA